MGKPPPPPETLARWAVRIWTTMNLKWIRIMPNDRVCLSSGSITRVKQLLKWNSVMFFFFYDTCESTICKRNNCPVWSNGLLAIWGFTILVVEMERQPSRSARSSKGRFRTSGLHHQVGWCFRVLMGRSGQDFFLFSHRRRSGFLDWMTLGVRIFFFLLLFCFQNKERMAWS